MPQEDVVFGKAGVPETKCLVNPDVSETQTRCFWASLSSRALVGPAMVCREFPEPGLNPLFASWSWGLQGSHAFLCGSDGRGQRVLHRPPPRPSSGLRKL